MLVWGQWGFPTSFIPYLEHWCSFSTWRNPPIFDLGVWARFICSVLHENRGWISGQVHQQMIFVSPKHPAQCSWYVHSNICWWWIPRTSDQWEYKGGNAAITWSYFKHTFQCYTFIHTHIYILQKDILCSGPLRKKSHRELSQTFSF